MVESASTPTAEQALRQFLQQYQTADEKAEFQRLVFGMYAALDVACGQTLNPKLGVAASKLNFSQKVQALLPDAGDVQALAASLLPRLNYYRRPVSGFSEEHVRATAAGFVDLALELWETLFGTPPPAVKHPLSPDLQALARPAELSPARLTPSTASPWPAILFALALITLIAWIGGFLRDPQAAIRRASPTPTATLASLVPPTPEATATPTAVPPTATPTSTPSPPPPTATPTPPPTATPTPALTDTPLPPTATPNPTPTPETTATPTSSPPPGPAAKFQIGDIVQVQTAGPGLNTRLSPGLDQTIVFSFEDETALTIVGGPRQADGLVWWEVTGLNARGWSAENYLVLAGGS